MITLHWLWNMPLPVLGVVAGGLLAWCHHCDRKAGRSWHL